MLVELNSARWSHEPAVLVELNSAGLCKEPAVKLKITAGMVVPVQNPALMGCFEPAVKYYSNVKSDGIASNPIDLYLLGQTKEDNKSRSIMMTTMRASGYINGSGEGPCYLDPYTKLYCCAEWLKSALGAWWFAWRIAIHDTVRTVERTTGGMKMLYLIIHVCDKMYSEVFY